MGLTRIIATLGLGLLIGNLQPFPINHPSFEAEQEFLNFAKYPITKYEKKGLLEHGSRFLKEASDATYTLVDKINRYKRFSFRVNEGTILYLGIDEVKGKKVINYFNIYDDYVFCVELEF